jgi:inward rectifier potassium channel
MKRRLRKQLVTVSGFRAVKLGMPSSIGDLYYLTRAMTWPAFIAMVSIAFVVINVVFGVVYANLPGAIANLTPGSIVDGFFFSIETLATVGYGDLAPATRTGHWVAAIEILTGLFFSATITGLIFARFARPRNSLIFSKIAVIGQLDGRRALMVRLTSSRAYPLADATAQIAWLERVELPDGRLLRRLVSLPLVRPHNAMLGLSWTLIHILEEQSAFLDALLGDQSFNLTVSVTGLDTLLASQSIGGHNYRREDILIDHEYVDVISDADGIVQLDLANFHEAKPIVGTTR